MAGSRACPPTGAAQMDAVMHCNAQVIPYTNDFLFMFLISVPALLVFFLMQKPAHLAYPPQLEAME